jgi:hypothetical protein
VGVGAFEAVEVADQRGGEVVIQAGEAEAGGEVAVEEVGESREGGGVVGLEEGVEGGVIGGGGEPGGGEGGAGGSGVGGVRAGGEEEAGQQCVRERAAGARGYGSSFLVVRGLYLAVLERGRFLAESSRTGWKPVIRGGAACAAKHGRDARATSGSG